LVLATALFASSWAAGQGKGKGGQHPNMHALQGQSLHEAVLHKEVELQLADNVVVRRKYPPDQRDDNGKLRKPTPAELKELKGPDPKAFGYSADLFDLKNGQQITVTLLKRKDDKSTAKPANNNDNAKPAAADKKNVDNAGNEWVFAGTLAGTLTATPHSTKKDSTNKMTLRVDSVTTTQGHHHNVQQGKNKKITMPDVKVSQIVILSKDLPPKDAAAKNN
jgi:hypothetical protein